jgi:hypothetical protein
LRQRCAYLTLHAICLCVHSTRCVQRIACKQHTRVHLNKHSTCCTQAQRIESKLHVFQAKNTLHEIHSVHTAHKCTHTADIRSEGARRALFLAFPSANLLAGPAGGANENAEVCIRAQARARESGTRACGARSACMVARQPSSPRRGKQRRPQWPR